MVELISKKRLFFWRENTRVIVPANVIKFHNTIKKAFKISVIHLNIQLNKDYCKFEKDTPFGFITLSDNFTNLNITN